VTKTEDTTTPEHKPDAVELCAQRWLKKKALIDAEQKKQKAPNFEPPGGYRNGSPYGNRAGFGY